MSRHRNIRTDKMRDVADFDDYDDYGRSVEDEMAGVSPATASQFIYHREESSSKNVHCPPTVDEEVDEVDSFDIDSQRIERIKYTNLKIGDQGKLISCIEYIESCAGEAFTRDQMEQAAVVANFNAERALSLLLENEGSIPESASILKTPFPQVTKRLENLSVSSERESEPPRKSRKIESVRPEVRQVVASEDPTLRSSQAIGRLQLTTTILPEWATKFLLDINQYNNSVAEALQAKHRKAHQDFSVNQTKSGFNRSSSTPDFQSIRTERSATTTPTFGSPKSQRKGSNKGTPSGPSPASTPTPGSPKPARKLSKDRVVGTKTEETTDIGSKTTKNAKLAAKVINLYQQRQVSSKPLISLVVIGHVDAGKSTLFGHLLYLLGKVDSKQMAKFEHEARKIGKSSFLYAWVLDETGEERSRGVTIDIAHTSFETPNRFVNLMDAPGHKDFIPNMITGTAQADVAVLVVDATRGEFETGFESGGQTREHSWLARSLGVTQVAVAVNKMDTVEWSQERFDYIVTTLTKFLKSAGYKDSDISFVPCSGFTGDNLIETPKKILGASWWKGPSLVEVIDNFRPPVRQIDKPYRQMITDVFKSVTGGCCITGRIESGHIEIGDKIIIMPANVFGTIKSIMLDSGASNDAFAGDNAILDLANIDSLNVHTGDVLCDPANPVAVTTVVRARIVLFTPRIPLLVGQEVSFHNQSFSESCIIKKLISQINKNTGEVLKKNPRALTKNTSGEVELLLQRPACLELYSNSKDLGRFMLRDSGSTIAAGLITQLCSV